MSRKAELIALLITDTLVLFVANLLFYVARKEWGWFGEPNQSVIGLTPVVLVITLLTVFWLVVFFFFGMYRERYAASRFDELVSLAKVVAVGILVLFLVLFIDQLDPGEAQWTVLFYWLTVFVLVALGRITVRSIQKALILRGYGLHKNRMRKTRRATSAAIRKVASIPPQ